MCLSPALIHLRGVHLYRQGQRGAHLLHDFGWEHQNTLIIQSSFILAGEKQAAGLQWAAGSLQQSSKEIAGPKMTLRGEEEEDVKVVSN